MENEVTDFSNMFSILPMGQRFLLKPGETVEGSITVVNPADAKQDFNYKATVTPYSVVGAEYTADLASKTNLSEMVDWITIENPTGTLKPNESKKINFKITVPESAAGGGQYATIAVSSDAQGIEGEGVTVNNIFEMASIIYAQVEGEINHEGEIKENTIPGYTAEVPLKTSIHLTNWGNVHEDATIVTKATNMFTGEVIWPREGETGKTNEIVMPGTEHYISEQIDNLPFLGMVHVEQTVYYMGVSSVEATNVLICPIWFLLLMIVTVGAIIAAVVRLILKHRRKKAEAAL